MLNGLIEDELREHCYLRPVKRNALQLAAMLVEQASPRRFLRVMPISRLFSLSSWSIKFGRIARTTHPNLFQPAGAALGRVFFAGDMDGVPCVTTLCAGGRGAGAVWLPRAYIPPRGGGRASGARQG